MENSVKTIIEGLKTAIKIENDGHYFYKMAIESIKDSKGKELFRILAAEELEHKKFLEAQYNSFMKEGKPTDDIVLADNSALSPENPIFSENIKERIGDAHFEMTALAIATQLELNSIKFYKQQSEKAQNKEVKEFYRKLVDWETVHYDALLHQDEALKQDYWDAHGFAPF